MKRSILLGAMLLAACATPKPAPERGLHDFGLPLNEAPSGVPLRIEVVLPPWLDGTDIVYRLNYDDPSRLRQYAGSRWAGRPSQLIAARLAGHFATGVARCVLRVELDEFAQHFASATANRLQLSGRWQIATLAGERLAGDVLREAEAAGADAAGGVQASVRLIDRIAGPLRAAAEQLPACRA